MNFAVFDIEAHDWTKFQVVGFYDGCEFRSFYNLSDFYAYITRSKYKSYRFFAHFGGRYDFYFILPLILNDSRRVSFIEAGSRIIQIKLTGKNNNQFFVDSYALLPASLDMLTRSFGVTHKKQSVDHTKKLNWRDPKNIEYLKHDCIGLYEVIEKFKCWGLNRGKLKPTIASQTLDVFRKKFLTEKLVKMDEISENFIRKTYFGGRCEIFRMWGENLNYYDVNSLYPYVMLDDMPCGKYYPTRVLIKNRIGFYWGLVTIPDSCKIPPVAVVRDKKLIFPVGSFDAYITSADIPNIVKSGGSFKVYRGCYFDQKKPLFARYINEMYEIKKRSAPDSPEYMISKLFLNSLYGRFGMRRDRENIVKPRDYQEVIDKNLTPYFEEYGLYKEPVTLKGNFIFPYLSSYITSLARSYLWQSMYKVGFDHIYYCDTDSMLIDTTIETGIELGEWKLERENITSAVFLQPKAYALQMGREEHIKLKGFSQHKLKFKDFQKALRCKNLENISAEVGRIMGMRENVKINHSIEIKRIKTIKRLRQFYNKRIITDNFDTKPLTMEI